MLVKRNICNINENKISKISIIVANEIIAIFFPHTMENQIVMLIQNKEILKNKKSHTLRVCSFSLSLLSIVYVKACMLITCF